MKSWTFQEFLGFILSIGLIAVLNILAWKKIIDPAMVAGADIGWAGMVIGFFYRKQKTPDSLNVPPAEARDSLPTPKPPSTPEKPAGGQA